MDNLGLSSLMSRNIDYFWFDIGDLSVQLTMMELSKYSPKCVTNIKFFNKTLLDTEGVETNSTGEFESKKCPTQVQATDGNVL